MLKALVAYGVLLATGALALQWIELRRLAYDRSGDLYLFAVGAVFLALGVWIGARVLSPRREGPQGNPQAVAALGVSPRELEILHELAAGRTNKEIARRLNLSPNTVKTHVARLFEKLGARRRTEALNRARLLGILN